MGFKDGFFDTGRRTLVGLGTAAAGYGAGQMARYFKKWKSRRSNAMKRKRYSGLSYVKKRRYTSGIGVTNDYDRKKIYSRKRMPFKKRKRWSRFVKKVKAVAQGDNALKSVVVNQAITISTGATGAQAVGVVHLYGKHGADVVNEFGCQDLNSILSADTELATSNGKVTFKSGIHDLTLTSVKSELDEFNEEVPVNIAPLEVDIYEIGHKKNRVLEENMVDAIVRAETEVSSIGGGFSSITLTGRGVVPFDLPPLLGNITIYKKTKYLLGVGESVTYQVRDPRNHQFDVQKIFDEDQDYVRLGMTRSLLVIAKQTRATSFQVHKLRMGSTRKYTYTYEGLQEYGDGYSN